MSAKGWAIAVLIYLIYLFNTRPLFAGVLLVLVVIWFVWVILHPSKPLDPDAPLLPPEDLKKRSRGVRFYRPVRRFRYTRHARKMAAVNTLARALAPRKEPKPQVGQTKVKNGKTYVFSASRRWKRVK